MSFRFPLVLMLLTLAGCGDDSPFEYVPVSGRITYDNGSVIPAQGIRLRFDSMDTAPQGEAYPRPGKTTVDAEGRFAEVTSYKYGDGLTPGKHKVSIDYATDDKGNSLVPKEYTHPSTTPLVVDTDQLPLEIKVPRP